MLIRANTDGTYSANWTPGAVGLYTIHVTIDGIEIGMSVYWPTRGNCNQPCHLLHLSMHLHCNTAEHTLFYFRCRFGGRSQGPPQRHDTAWHSDGQTKG